MVKKENRSFAVIINFLLLFLFSIFHQTQIFSIKIYQANPLISLALLISLSMFSSELFTAVCGLFCGLILDSGFTASSCFNTLTFIAVGMFCALISHYLFNKGIKSAVALCFIGSFVYFLIKWIVFYTFSSDIDNSLFYLLKIALPSTVYTTVFSIPFYFLEKALYKKSENY